MSDCPTVTGLAQLSCLPCTMQHHVQVKANTSFNITPCNAATFCGHSSPTGSDAGYACQSIALPADASAGTLAEAQQALLSMCPPSVDVLLQVSGGSYLL